MAHRFTIGVEEEFQIIDPATCELRSHVMQLVNEVSPSIQDQVKHEMHQSIVETGTKICENVGELRIESRAIFVVDPENKIRHAEYVKEVADHPNYEAALSAARNASAATA